MQMYAGLPIITNKVKQDEQQGIPHHLLGHIQLDEETWRIGTFQKRARSMIKQIQERGKIPVVVGGTHYYIQSLLFQDSILNEDGCYRDDSCHLQSPTETPIESTILDGPPHLILEKLKEVDPVMAGRWHPNDTRKIRRSLEIYLRTGERASDLYARQQKSKDLNLQEISSKETVGGDLKPESTLLFWIHTEAEVLKKRLDDRVGKMMEAGLLNEIKSMDKYLQTQRAAGVKIDSTRGIWASIGWKEFKPFLDSLNNDDERDSALDLSLNQMQTATRNYAKRQLRWIRLKLKPALAQSHMWNERLYLFDGTDLDRFQENVTDLASTVTNNFLAGRELQPPQEISSVAKSILGEIYTKPDVWFQKTCSICKVTSVNDVEWIMHLKSRKHRQMVKKAKNLENPRYPRNSKTETA